MLAPMAVEDLALLRRARDTIDRDYAQPLDVPALARVALMSPAHFSRQFHRAYGEGPYSYLMTRRMVGCTSLGSFSSRFTELVGETPSAYRAQDHRALRQIPACYAMRLSRPSRH